MKLQTAAQLTFAIAAAVGIYSFVQMARDSETRRICSPLCHAAPRYAGTNRRAPDFELSRLGGGSRRLSDYQGQVVVLNFWTRSCAPCLSELPSLADLAARLRTDKSGVVVTVNASDSEADVAATLKEVLGAPPSFEVLLDPDLTVVLGKFGTKLYPETWLIDAKGIIRARMDGERDYGLALWSDLVRSLDDLRVCPVEFAVGVPRGKGAELCEELAGR